MGCNNPLHAFDTGFLTESGKPLYKIVGKDIEWIYKPKDPEFKNVYTDYKLTDFIEIPCGKCLGCRLKYSKDWANRCLLESKGWTNNYFITLSYAPEKVPINSTNGNLTLHPKDLQDFMKRLRIKYQRKYGHDNIRFFACGEYGSTTSRPHYHILAFNLPLFDLEPLKKTSNGDQLWISREIDEIWGNGNTWIGEVNWNTCAYVARYIIKKQKGPGAQDYYSMCGEVPEFVRMSRRPGIGYKYFEENKEKIYQYDEILIKKKGKINRYDKFSGENITTKVESIKPSRYYDKLYDLEEHEFMEALRKQRKKAAKEAMKVQMSKTDKTRNEYLEQIEQRLEMSIKQLKRNLE